MQDCNTSRTADSRFLADLVTITALQKLERPKMLHSLRNLLLRHQNGLLACMFVAAIAIAAFGGGAYVGHYRVFPYYVIREAALGVRAIVRDVTNTSSDSMQRRVSEFSTVETAANRIRNPGALTAGLLWPGGEGMFREYCPERGCLAVEFSQSGDVVHAYPYRLDEVNDWEKIVDLPRGTAHPFQSPEVFQIPHAVRRYSNGDLMVVFSYGNGAPGKGGVARIDRDGMPVWVRSDYSHHWPTIFSASDGQELALVPGMTIEDVPVKERLDRHLSAATTNCRSINEADHLVILDGDGATIQDIRLIDKIIESPFAAMVFHTTSPCDVLHLNYIDQIGEDISGIPDVVPGDYVVSLRNLSAFGILDGQTGEIKLMVRGTFIHQHSVQHLGGSEFIVFDNHGADAESGPSRVLVVDLEGGAVRERTVYPTDDTLKELRIYSRIRGNLAISEDRQRLLVSSSDQGIALEMQVSDGAVLNVFRNIHDMSGLSLNLEEAGDKAIYFVLKDLQYVE